MKVDREKAIAAELAGESFYFCSEHCRDAFTGAREKARVGWRRGEQPTNPAEIWG